MGFVSSENTVVLHPGEFYMITEDDLGKFFTGAPGETETGKSTRSPHTKKVVRNRDLDAVDQLWQGGLSQNSPDVRRLMTETGRTISSVKHLIHKYIDGQYKRSSDNPDDRATYTPKEK